MDLICKNKESGTMSVWQVTLRSVTRNTGATIVWFTILMIFFPSGFIPLSLQSLVWWYLCWGNSDSGLNGEWCAKLLVKDRLKGSMDTCTRSDIIERNVENSLKHLKSNSTNEGPQDVPFGIPRMMGAIISLDVTGGVTCSRSMHRIFFGIDLSRVIFTHNSLKTFVVSISIRHISSELVISLFNCSTVGISK